jgi:hypothetical protein
MKYKLFALLFVSVLLISSVSAFDFDDVFIEGNINPRTGYPNLEIKNCALWAGVPPILGACLIEGETLFEGKLEEHTDKCGEDCYSKMEINHTGGVLIDDIEFRTMQNDGSYIIQPIREYSFEYETDDGFMEYVVGEEVPEGNYELYLRGKKKPTRTVDWVIKIHGRWLEEWAIWDGFSDYDDFEDGVINSTLWNVTLVDSTPDGNPSVTESSGKQKVYSFASASFVGAYSSAESNATRLLNNSNFYQINATISYTNTNPSNPVRVAKIMLGSTDVYEFTTFQSGVGTFSGENVTAEIKNENNVISYRYSLEGGAFNAWTSTSEDENSKLSFFTKTTRAGAGYGGSTTIEAEYVAFMASVLNSPEDNSSFANSIIDFNCSGFSSVGATVSNISLFTNHSGTFELVNSSTGLTGESNNSIFSNDLESDGNYLWNCQVCDSDGDCGFAQQNNTVIVDTISPSISIISPTGDQGSFTIGNNLSLNWSITDTNLDSCWFEYNSVNTTLTCADNNYSFTTVDGEQSINFYANDTAGNSANSSTSWTYSFVENNAIFNNITFETSNENFILNLTTDETILSISGNMNYDGVNYLSSTSCNSGNCLLSNNIDIPTVDSGDTDTNNFYWNFTIFNGTSSNNIQTSTRQQTVNKTFLELCNATYTIKTLNFTAFDELNLSQISNFKFDSTFYFWIGSGSSKRNATYSSNGTEINLCMKDDLNYSVDSKIDYDEYGNTTTYNSRFYYMENESISSEIKNISLYLLQSASSTSFILKVQDQNLLPVEDALISIQRCYANEIDCRTVQIAKTDENGKSIGFFQTETVDYKFIIVKNSETLLETGTQKVVPETSPFTLTFNIGDDLGAPWSGSEAISDLNSTLTFNSSSGIVTYIYIDTSGNFTLANLTVTKNSLSNSTATNTICSDTSTLSSSTITCNIGNTTGFYTASGYITRSGTALDKQISFQIEDVSSVVGFLGLFYGFFLLLVVIFIFKFNEIAGVWLLVVSIILLNITGLIKFGMVFVTSIIVLAIIITWLLEK